MTFAFVLAALALGLSLVFTPLVRALSISLDLTDAPDGARKLHRNAIPRTGGVAIAFAYGAVFFLAAITLKGTGTYSSLLATVALPGTLMFLVGLTDDIFPLRPVHKLAGQVAAAGAAYLGGLRIERVGGFETGDGFGLCLTLLWLVGCSNAFNLIDGVDGLAAGVGLVATLTTFAAAVLQGNTDLAVVTLPLAGALLGFLRFNFNPASIFLGDSGSLLIGFLLAAYGVIWSQKSAALLGLTAPVMALAVPLMDVGLSVLRRFLKRSPIFRADRGHIHHRLLDAGFTPRKTSLILYACCTAGATLSLAHMLTQGRLAGVLVILFCGAAISAVHFLGYEEFAAVGRVLKRDVFRSALAAEVSAAKTERTLREATSVEACIEILTAGSAELGFDRTRSERETVGSCFTSARIRVEFQVPGQERLVFVRDDTTPWKTTGAIEALGALQRTLASRVQQLSAESDPLGKVRAAQSLLALAEYSVQGAAVRPIESRHPAPLES